MANVIVIKKGAGVPSPDSLEQAELALDTSTGDLYTKLADGSVALLNDGADGGCDLISTEGINNISVGTLYMDGEDNTALGMQGGFGGYVLNNSVGVGFDAKGSENSVAVGWATEARKRAIAIGYNTRAWGDHSTALGSAAFIHGDHEYSVAIGSNAATEEPQQVMFGTAPDATYGKPLNLKTYGTVQAADFLDEDGNSIIGTGGGGGGGSSVHIGENPPASPQEGQQWMEVPASGEAKMWVYDNGNGGQWLQQPGSSGGGLEATFYPEYEYDAGGALEDKEDVWETTNLAAEWLYASSEFYAKNSYFSQQISSPSGLSSNISYGAVSSGFGLFTELFALGGINIPASAENLPFSIDEEDREAVEKKAKSIQKALTVTHETLGRTVEIDKEGIIRANQFTDMDGSPIAVSPATMVDAFTTLQTAIADETTIEGIKTALTNSLGGLIEKFEGMQNV